LSIHSPELFETIRESLSKTALVNVIQVYTLFYGPQAFDRLVRDMDNFIGGLQWENER